MTKARILADYVAGGTTAAEFDYMDGVTSNVQTQLNAKAPTASPAITGGLTVDGATVFNEASADVDFRVESNGNANMLVVDAGNDRIGVGTATPAVLLDLDKGDSATTESLRIENANHTAGNAINFTQNGTTVGNIESDHDGSWRMRLKADGGTIMTLKDSKVGIGTEAPDAALCTESTGVPLSVYRVHSSTGAGVINAYSNVSSTKNHIFALEADGDVFNETGSYSSGTSDERLKTDIQDTSTKLDKLLALPIKTFYKISRPDLKMIGVIAQDLEKVLPNLVETVEVTKETGKAQKDEDGKILLNDDEKPYVLDKDGNKLTSYKRTKDSLLLFCAIKAIQELSAKVTALENA